MSWNAKYIENSLYFEPWKTKFIEVFVREFTFLKRNYNNFDQQQKSFFMEYYTSIFKTALKILKNRLKVSNNKKLFFVKDIIEEAYNKNLISKKQAWFDAIDFIRDSHYDVKYCSNFKREFIEILEDFSIRIKPLILKEGFVNENYFVYDNSECFWGIEKHYYNKIIRLFLSFDKLKIVRICGSRITKDYRVFSDIDLICEGTYSLEEFNTFSKKLYSLKIPYLIDMNDIYKSSKPFIYRNIIKSNIFYNRSNYCSEDYTSILNQ